MSKKKLTAAEKAQGDLIAEQWVASQNMMSDTLIYFECAAPISLLSRIIYRLTDVGKLTISTIGDEIEGSMLRFNLQRTEEEE